MTCLPDVNVWIALASERHVHHRAAKNWMEGLNDEQIAFCRITEMGFLRLVTNSQVMGKDVLNSQAAWLVYDNLRADPRVVFLPEQAGFGEVWRNVGRQMSGGTNAWTDAYLAAFAAHAGATVVTFDRRFRPLGGEPIVTLAH